MRNRFLPSLLAVLALAAACDDVRSPTASAEDVGISKAICADCESGGGGGGGGGGTTTTEPFNPPPRPFFFASDLPVIFGGFDNVYQRCEQIPHVGIAFSNDVTRGTVLYAWGVSVRDSRANFGFYNQFGQRVKTHATQPTRDNCVIHHEPEEIGTWDLAPGYYYVYSSYWSLSTTNIDSFEGDPFAHQGRYITTIRIR